MNSIRLTPEEARMLIEIHEIDSFMADEEEVDCLEANNPQLLLAYRKLMQIANGD
jgi:hypothetical protein